MFAFCVCQDLDTPLYEASRLGQTEVCQYLISSGASVHSVNEVSLQHQMIYKKKSAMAKHSKRESDNKTFLSLSICLKYLVK